jgi:type I restriction enzyme, S subunit
VGWGCSFALVCWPHVCQSGRIKIQELTGLEDNVLSLSYGNIIRRNVEDNFGLMPESFNTYQIVKSGDVIFRLTELQNDKRSLRVGLAKEGGIITSAYLNLRGKLDIDPFYLYQLLLPPLPEQSAIVAHLDEKCGKIDQLKAKAERGIKLLKERRSALISAAVTGKMDVWDV